jgi:hypothetical protein
MKTIAIMQPTYLPWLGYFELMKRSDIFVIYDCVQFEKQSWQQRNRIRAQQEALMLTVSVKTKGKLLQKINEVEIDKLRQPCKKHFHAIKMNYSKSRNFELIIGELEKIYFRDQDRLIDLNMDLIELGRKMMKINTPMIFADTLDVHGSKVPALIDICKKTGATHYYSPLGSKGYIDENNLFPENNIELSYQHYNHPVYKQMHYPDFISHLSFIDYLFNTEELVFPS